MTDQQLIDEGYKNGKKSFEYLYEKIDKAFNYKRVYDTMKALDWFWHMGNENYGIPNINTIRAKAKALLFEVYEKGSGMISTAGFCAGIEDGELWISFSIEDHHTCSL